MVTIVDIAKETGLSISICSRYFNHIRVRKKNADAIEKAAKKLGYIPNELARNLRKEKSFTVGAIIPSLIDSFPLSVLNVVEKKLNANNYSLLLSNSQRDEEREYKCAVSLIQKKVEALVILPISNCHRIAELCKKYNIPLIIFDQYIDDIQTADFVLFDNVAASQKATKVILKKGHKNIAIVIGPKNEYTPKERLAGFEAECSKHKGIKTYVVEADGYSSQDAYAALMKFKHINEISAIYATNFDMTLGVVKALNKKGLKIPTDISLMGFDYLPTFEYIQPNLSSIYQSTSEIGSVVCDRIFSRFENKNADGRCISYVSVHEKRGESISNLAKKGKKNG